tara:strand:+ start:29410 stop:30036 length:627 start_codon:yes stop_codon:yes gene_type:complete
MKLKFILAASVVAFASQVQAAPVNLVQNGSFEADAVASGTFIQQANSITNWTTDQGAFIEIRNNIVGQASDGVNFVELDSTVNSNIYQTIATTAGQAYTLSFDYSPRIDQLSDTNGISALWNGSVISVPAIITGAGGVSNVWTTYVFTVIGTGSDILAFSAEGISDSYGGGIDNVSVNAVPLPAAAFLFAPALLGFMGLRRKAKNSVA